MNFLSGTSSSNKNVTIRGNGEATENTSSNISKQIMQLCFLSNLCWTDSTSRRKRRLVYFGDKYDDFYRRLDEKCLDQRHKFHCEFKIELYCEKIQPIFTLSQKDKSKKLYYNEIISLLRLHLNYPTLVPLTKDKHEYASIIVMNDDEILSFLENVKSWIVGHADNKPRIVGETLKARRK